MQRSTASTLVVKHLRRAAIVFAVIIATMSAGILLAERDITYRLAPGAAHPSAAGLHGVRAETLSTPDGARLVAWTSPAQPGQPTILYFHGNGEPLGYRATRIKAFQAEGWGVYMLAWRGYSGSTGEPTERANVADAKLAYETLRLRRLAPHDIIIYGESMGSSVAVQTAIDNPARAVVLEAPFTSMVATWRQFVPFLPVGLLLTDRYETLKVIGRLDVPLLILHGRRDWLIWPGQGRTLYAAAPGPKRLVEFPGAGHKNLYNHGAIDAVRRFIADLNGGAIAQ
jgi:uncharacterized protein